MTYTEAQYRADMAEAISRFHWWQRPIVRLAVWIVERRDRWQR